LKSTNVRVILRTYS